MDKNLDVIRNEISICLEKRLGISHEEALKIIDNSVCPSDSIIQTSDRVVFRINDSYTSLSLQYVAFQPQKFIRSLLALGISISSLNLPNIIISLCDVFDYFFIKLTYEEASVLAALYLEQSKHVLTDDNVYQVYVSFSEKRTDRYIKDKDEFYQALNKLDKMGIVSIIDGVYKVQDLIVCANR